MRANDADIASIRVPYPATEEGRYVAVLVSFTQAERRDLQVSTFARGREFVVPR